MSSQSEVARRLRLSKQRVSELFAAGVLPDGGHGHHDIEACLDAYIEHLREQAAGRMGTDATLNLADERAALARAQREA